MWLFKGSALLANLDVHEQTQLASGGPSYVWVVHGARKKNTNQTVALFTFHKSYQETLNPLAAKNPSQKREQDEVNQLLRQEVQKLSRLRHPTILEVNEPLEDLRSAMVFATEPVLCNLGNLFGNTANFANGHPRHLGRGYELDEVELPRGILQIGRALEFLHRHRIVHTNISPASIFVNEKGDWKLGGFAFCVTLPPGAAQTAECIASQYPPICSPDLDFVAPEIVLNSQCAAESDLFSLGCLIYALYHQGRSPLDTAGNESRYRDELPRLASKDLRGIPADLQPMVRRLCATERSARPSIDEFNQCGYFSSLLIKTIHYLDTLTLKTQVEKAQFLKGLNQVLPQFSARTLRLKILSSLLLELKDPVIAPFLLPNIFYIVEQQPPDAPETRAMLRDVVFPAIKPVFTLTEPPQAAVLLLSRIDMLRKRAYPSSEEFRAHVWPLIWASLSTTSITVLTQACKSIAHFADDFDYATITSSLWPRFAFLYKETQNVGLKTGVLIAVYALMKHLDKTFLVETVLPLMIQPSRPRDAGLIMACLAIWEEAAKSLSRQQVAHHIMTELWMSCLDPALQPSQYKRFMTVIHALTEKLEREHTSHLETVKSVESVGQPNEGPGGSTLAKITDIASFSKFLGNAPAPGSLQESQSVGLTVSNPLGNDLDAFAGMLGASVASVGGTPPVVPAAEPRFPPMGTINPALTPLASPPVLPTPATSAQAAMLAVPAMIPMPAVPAMGASAHASLFGSSGLATPAAATPSAASAGPFTLSPPPGRAAAPSLGAGGFALPPPPSSGRAGSSASLLNGRSMPSGQGWGGMASASGAASSGVGGVGGVKGMSGMSGTSGMATPAAMSSLSSVGMSSLTSGGGLAPLVPTTTSLGTLGASTAASAGMSMGMGMSATPATGVGMSRPIGALPPGMGMSMGMGGGGILAPQRHNPLSNPNLTAQQKQQLVRNQVMDFDPLK